VAEEASARLRALVLFTTSEIVHDLLSTAMRSAAVCTVFPRPMQSPKMPPVLAWYFLYSHSTPERW